VPPGAYEVTVGAATARTYVEMDTLLRMTAEPGRPDPAPEPTRYQQKVRAATSYAAAYDVSAVREDLFN
jgi:hypothetical protein